MHLEHIKVTDFGDGAQFYDLSFDFGELNGKVYAHEINYRTADFFETNEGLIVESGKYTFDIYYRGCEGVKVNTITVELKKFNEYSFLSIHIETLSFEPSDVIKKDCPS